MKLKQNLSKQIETQIQTNDNKNINIKAINLLDKND